MFLFELQPVQPGETPDTLKRNTKKELKKGNDFGGFFVLTRPPPKRS